MVNATLQVKPLHPTFAAEIAGVDFSQPITPELYKEIRAVVDKYGVVVLRNTGLTDDAHIDFSRYFGDLDDVTPYQQAGRTHRLPSKYLFDAGNIDPKTGDVAAMTDATVIGNKGNLLFHVDSSFNARRAGHSLLKAHKLPPPGTGGATEFSDSRTAYDDLSPEMKARIDGAVANHSLFHSRKTAMPEYFKDMDVTKMPMSKHLLAQKHEWSDRMNLYIASYVHHLDGMPKEESDKILKELTEHIYKDKYRQVIPWEQDGDLIIWDNTSVMHRGTGGSYEGKYPRDMRRTTVKDMSSTRYGLNGDGADWRVGMP
ncbi:uncharacterized protein MKK02DRAFT_16738 [Dioszegia hungarica]|uniref:TauD/TfdA-like domain-containing protein n=1 Tax=Dioszegia hungarica TaxID=4972 RepID=A0AA38H6A9_9TREE|nr:uncharacterized protein MKK02DRAFT_16738 [Dioszegia hungarica]KAI9634491.1 hypothetical protein MKK02DRAFT_16738 [Dioszegia hungarica]